MATHACSPANSSNHKLQKLHLSAGAAPKCTSEASFLPEYENNNSQETCRRSGASNYSAEQFMGKGGKGRSFGGDKRKDSSHRRFATPSPIYSTPVSSLSSDISSDSLVSTGANHSFDTANQSFSIKSNGAEKTGERSGRRAGIKNTIATRAREENSGETYNRKVKKLQLSERSVSSGSTIFDGEDEIETSERSRQHRSVLPPPLLSSCSVGSRPIGTPSEEMSQSEAEYRIISWKESSTTRLINRQKKEEARIDAWEKMKKEKARKKMNDLEARLEKKREIGMEKMKRKMELARRKAERKKLKEREAIACQVDKLEASFEKMTLARYKAPWWRLLFF